MFRTAAYKHFSQTGQISQIAAILALVLLCAQTMVVVHDHHDSEPELCAVCSTSAEDAIAPAAASADVPLRRSTLPVVGPYDAPRVTPTRANHARAPPIA